MFSPLIEALSTHITPERWAMMQRVISQRTHHISVTLEDIFQPHNASAVLRTCDCFGLQDVHIIEEVNHYKLNPKIVLGASQWVSMHRYSPDKKVSAAEQYIAAIKKSGHLLVATSPRAEGYTPDSLPLDQPLSIAFGTELTGMSDYLMDQADMHLRVPMYGFTESYNISVSAAMIMYRLTERLRDSEINWQLDATQQDIILEEWISGTLYKGEATIAEYKRRLGIE